MKISKKFIAIFLIVFIYDIRILFFGYRNIFDFFKLKKEYNQLSQKIATIEDETNQIQKELMLLKEKNSDYLEILINNYSKY